MGKKIYIKNDSIKSILNAPVKANPPKVMSRHQKKKIRKEMKARKHAEFMEKLKDSAPSQEYMDMNSLVINSRGYLEQANGVTLHRSVCFRAHGPIPKEWHVHHIDGNRFNNDSENLIALPCYVHQKAHRKPVLPSRDELMVMIREWELELAEVSRELARISPEYTKLKKTLNALIKKDFKTYQ